MDGNANSVLTSKPYLISGKSDAGLRYRSVCPVPGCD